MHETLFVEFIAFEQDVDRENNYEINYENIMPENKTMKSKWWLFKTSK